MEKFDNRRRYLSDFYEFLSLVVLDDNLIEALKSHPFFGDFMDYVTKFPDREKQKIFIFLEFTQRRYTCDAIAELLRKANQIGAADILKEYNTSLGRLMISSDIVKQGYPNKGSNVYNMTKNPRGKCIIINNIIELFDESERFANIFRQLYFEVKTEYKLRADRIRDTLVRISKDESLRDHEALIVMITSHGGDDMVFGYDQFTSNDSNDIIKISDIVDIFSRNECCLKKRLPRMFFFNCCRDVTPAQVLKLNDSNAGESFTLKWVPCDKTWVNQNRDTFIYFACSEGFESFYNANFGYSYFGKAFGDSLIQYACEQNLDGIMNRTCRYLQDVCPRVQFPECRSHCPSRELHFNPGFPKN